VSGCHTSVRHSSGFAAAAGFVSECVFVHCLTRSPAAASGGCQQQVAAAAAASSLLIFNSLSLTHCVCVLCFIIVCALYRLAGRELARCNINHTTVTKGIFDLHRSQANENGPREKKSRKESVFCFLPADFLVPRALGGNAFNQVRRFFLFTKGISLAAGNGKYYFASPLSA
jgi:hypothetical protein